MVRKCYTEDSLIVRAIPIAECNVLNVWLVLFTVDSLHKNVLFLSYLLLIIFADDWICLKSADLPTFPQPQSGWLSYTPDTTDNRTLNGTWWLQIIGLQGSNEELVNICCQAAYGGRTNLMRPRWPIKNFIILDVRPSQALARSLVLGVMWMHLQ